jgi:hypothetical protein
MRMENYKQKEWLKREYVDNRRTANDIALSENRDAKTIWSWLKKFGIPTRPRGAESSPGTFKKGHLKGVGRKHTEETKAKIRDASIADGRVPWGKGNEPYWKGKTGESHPSYKGGLTPERQSVYSSQEWVDAVKKVWARDNATCQRCGKHHNTAETRGTFHVHHVVSFQVKELQTEPSNLVLLCRDCHKFVHSKKNINKIFIKDRKC